MAGMGQSDSTCWTLVRGTAAGRPEDRETFVRRCAQVIKAYLAAIIGSTGLVLTNPITRSVQ